MTGAKLISRCSFAFVAVIALCAGCAKTPQDPNDPEDGVWNPLDCNAPPGVFLAPKVQITAGPRDGQLWPGESATFQWKGSNDAVAEYVPYLDSVPVGSRDTVRSVRLVNLDEGRRTFHVLAYYRGCDRTDSLPEVRTFTVDALPTAIYLSPRLHTLEPGQDFSLDIKAKKFAGVDTQRVKGLRIVLSLPTTVTYLGLDTLGAAGYLAQANGRVFCWNTPPPATTITLEMARTGDPPTTPPDSGTVARLRLRAGLTASTDSVRVVECEVFNGNNNLLRNVLTRGAWVEVK